MYFRDIFYMIVLVFRNKLYDLTQLQNVYFYDITFFLIFKFSYFIITNHRRFPQAIWGRSQGFTYRFQVRKVGLHCLWPSGYIIDGV